MSILLRSERTFLGAFREKCFLEVTYNNLTMSFRPSANKSRIQPNPLYANSVVNVDLQNILWKYFVFDPVQWVTGIFRGGKEAGT
jgi:hypothetical protein